MSDTSITVEPPPSTAAWWEDLVDVFLSPSQLFERRRDGRFGLTLVVLTILMAALIYATRSALAGAFAAEFQRAMARATSAGQEVNAEQIARLSNVSGWLSTMAALVTFPIGVFVTGLLVWVVGRIFESPASVAVAVTIATYAQFPKVLQSVATILQGLIFDPASLSAVSIGPARFVDPTQVGAGMIALLGRLDVFTVWSTILLGIGMHVAGRVPRREAYLAAVLVWGLATLPAVYALLRA